MFKINNKIIIFSLIIIVISVLGIMIVPTETKAQAYGGNISYPGNPDSNYYQNYYSNNYPTYYQTPNYYVPTPAPIVYVNPTPIPTPIIYSTTVNPSANIVAPAPKAVAKAKTNTSTNTSKTNNNLVASAVSGNDNFMPSSLSEWIVFVILVLLIVALARKIYGGKEKYDSVPMKHA